MNHQESGEKFGKNLMPYTVEILKRAEKFLRSINDAKLYRKIREAIDSLEMDPFRPEAKN